MGSIPLCRMEKGHLAEMQEIPLDKNATPGTVASAPHVRRLGILIGAIGAAIILAATLTPQPGETETPILCVVCGSLGGVDAVLNFFLFIPLGVGLGMSGARPRTALGTIFLLSLSIEVTQYFLIAGRDATIGDVITNTLGGSFGFTIASNAQALLFPRRRTAIALAIAWGATWLALQSIVSYALLPTLPESRYYGQIGRSFSDLSPFLGQVLSATIGDVTVPDFGYAKTSDFRDRLAHGEFVSSVVIPAGPTRKIAPILRVADDSQREIALLGQLRRDLAFGVYTGAVALRLRPLRFALPGVFPATGNQWVVAAGSPPTSAGDTLSLGGRFGSTGVELRASSSRGIRGSRLSVDPSLGWTLILPRQWYVRGTTGELILSLIWTGLLIFPAGYWLAFANAMSDDRASTRGASVVSAALLAVAGFTIVPRAIGLHAARPATWLAALVGLVIGWLVARFAFHVVQGKHLANARNSHVASPPQF